MKEIQFDENSTHCLKMGDFVLKFEKSESSLEEDYLRKAAEELRENPEIRMTALNELKELISSKFLLSGTDFLILVLYFKEMWKIFLEYDVFVKIN